MSRTGTQVTVTVPQDAPPGTILAVPIKGGAETLKVRVPEGLGPGSTLLLTRPEGVEQWALSVGKVVPEVKQADGMTGGSPANGDAEDWLPRSTACLTRLPKEQRQKELEKAWLQQQAPLDLPMTSVAFTVRFETTVGTIDIVVRPDWAPHGTLRFLELAAAGDFDDRAFYRAVPSCIVQFGLPPKHELSAIPERVEGVHQFGSIHRFALAQMLNRQDDPPTGVPFLLGAVAFAAVGENTRRSTIFICTGDMSHCLGRQSWETPIGAVAELLAIDAIGTGWRWSIVGDCRVPILVDPGASYEACPAALLMALLSCGARAAAAQRVQLLERWHDAYAAWNSLPWTKSLAWHNLQDPLVRLGLYAVVSQSKVITACLLRPEDLCSKVISTASDALDRAAGMSLSVAYDRYSNLPGYGDLAHSMHVMSNYPHLLDSAASCVGARLLAHLFTARRLLDLQPNWAERHLQSAQELTRLLLQNDSQHPSYGGAVNVLGHGLEVHQHWMKQTAERAGPVAPSLTGVSPSMAPFGIWERHLEPVFSESLKDPVLERIFALIGITNGYYVEVGTQSAEQCNTRYLRVRYGFHGLLVDDNFQNPHVNQTRRA
eukprot:g8824.t1